ncbi:hypothetical protein BS47DRAFT_1356180 [Hydnum rufescens UP504]|uniref:Uncharacterized protein n=1 Tax=Hydnum rufescens UP504 TaxID=1448309 RepID=A0A9P6AD07_9AGAM|nr:hypothetical protein BS47DRAFT_1356180 [Hydnum rufescens UP504]
MESSNHGLYIRTGDGGGTEGNATEMTIAGRGGDVLLSHSTTNHVYIYHVYGHKSNTPIMGTQLSSGIYILCRYGPFELRIGLVARLFPLVIRIYYHG